MIYFRTPETVCLLQIGCTNHKYPFFSPTNPDLFTIRQFIKFISLHRFKRGHLRPNQFSQLNQPVFLRIPFLNENGVVATTSCDAIEKLLKILERWSVQTYEGRKVPFGFIVNPNEKGTFDWLEFLEDDYSATLTDCINSLIELDTDGKLIKYHSLPETFLGRDEGIGARPYRFVDVLINYVSMGRIGIFLLSNGDIILSDDTKIRFVKRNLKWLNMSYEAFESVLRDVNLSPPLTLKMINELYASILDVSFAHTGGIISIVSDIQSLVNKNSRNSILSPSDNLANPRDDSLVLTKKLKYQKIGDKEVKKRLLKREAIVSLIGNDNFYGLARKLRAELIAMDGACIINPEGEIYSIGAIIRNKGGSSGGGRSAACKQLSEFGIAIKISTDGYIEVFKGGEAVYTVK